VKLPLREAEFNPLLAELSRWDGYVSSALLGVEAVRACARYGDRYAVDAQTFLMDVALLPLDDSLLAEAASIGPHTIRSLDALHLATALSIRDEVGAFITYDLRLAEAARSHDLDVACPA
jgi:predicted nucleic acid-binding protein